jgi:histidinol-phosphate aminotransferase
MSPKAREVILKSIDEIYRYPDGNAFKLKNAVSLKFNLHPDSLIFGNGSNDILELASRTFLKVGDEVLIDYAKRVGIPYNTLRDRLHNGRN